jgi:hypothetical protein
LEKRWGFRVFIGFPIKQSYLEFGEKELTQKKIPLLKVLWNHHPVEDATWETESEMRQLYPELFKKYLNFGDEIFVRSGGLSHP